jgi:hypothetical protein
MRSKLNEKLEQGRFREGHYASRSGDLHGAFKIAGPAGKMLAIISSGVDDTYGWEHVSISTASRTPTWEEMSYVKQMFWGDDECVMQLHPPQSEYVNHHPHCLHLWRPLRVAIPTPPSLLVGPRQNTVDAK